LNNNRTLLLTGGTGFLGSNLIHRFVQSNFRLVILVRSVSNLWRIQNLLNKIIVFNIDETPLEEVFCNEQIDIIVHCATNYGRKEIDPLEILDANLMLPLKLMQLGAKHGISCFVNTDTILDKRINFYSLSKSQFKEWLKLYASVMTCCNVALEHFYGPGDDRTKFVTFIIRNLLENVDQIPLTAGEQKRDFIYINDVVNAFFIIIEKALGADNGYISYEIGTGEAVSIRDFVCHVSRLVGNNRTHLDFGAQAYRDHEVMTSSVDLTAIRNLGWSPSYSLEEGLRLTIEIERHL